MQVEGIHKTAASISDITPIALHSIADWIESYRTVRQQSEALCRPLHDEDLNLQAVPEVSPPKWHLAHTTWFFETLWLKPFDSRYREFDPRYAQLFNSYYQTLGQPFPRGQRGMLSRPNFSEVIAFRHEIDQRVENRLRNTFGNPLDLSPDLQAMLRRLQLGMHHEQQHQELLLTDTKFNFFYNPLLPAYAAASQKNREEATTAASPLNWCEFPGGFVNIGAATGGDFSFDNESPRHRVFLQPFALADRLVNNADYLEFMRDGGYQRPELWLSDGWMQVQEQQWRAPLYWIANDNDSREGWQVFTLHGLSELCLADPVCHISYYEADAFARWAHARLPTEAEWENAASLRKVEGHFVDAGVLHPGPPCDGQAAPRQLYGDVWEWTASAYAPYPGFQPGGGAVGAGGAAVEEYNGKFMCNQMVLRGGSCVSAGGHVRATYRNFFYPRDRWQFSGVRLARTV